MKPLEEMTLKELWQLFPIVLEAPDHRWFSWADEEIRRLRAVLNTIHFTVYHIGSTAVPNIWAKPIVDLILEVPDITAFTPVKAKLTEAGYICMNITDFRMDFNRGYTPAGFAEKVFHVHVRVKGDTDEIYFRDYLICHPEIAKEYETLKLSLWKTFEHDRNGYTEAKSDFVRHYTAEAKRVLIRST